MFGLLRVTEAATVDTNDLLIVLLTGGGLTLIGTIVGTFITQAYTRRLGHEARQEERRLAIKTFQRDTLVALQDAVVEELNSWRAAKRADRQGAAEEQETAWEAQRVAETKLEMLASRVRDEQLRASVDELIESQKEWDTAAAEGGIPGIPTRKTLQRRTAAMRTIYDRAGELIRTLDAIDDASL